MDNILVQCQCFVENAEEISTRSASTKLSLFTMFFSFSFLLVPARRLLHQRALSKTLWWKCRVNVMQRVRLLWIDWVSGQAGVSAERSSQSVVQVSAIVLRLEQEMASIVYGAARLSMDAAVVAAISTCNFSEQSKFSRWQCFWNVFGRPETAQRRYNSRGKWDSKIYLYIGCFTFAMFTFELPPLLLPPYFSNLSLSIIIIIHGCQVSSAEFFSNMKEKKTTGEDIFFPPILLRILIVFILFLGHNIRK
jgi:hypothetical protein